MRQTVLFLLPQMPIKQQTFADIGKGLRVEL
jgi:hypothetical protein